jgi:branched-chain amino acid aminotransferase
MGTSGSWSVGESVPWESILGRCPEPQIVIIIGEIQLYPEEYYQKGHPNHHRRHPHGPRRMFWRPGSSHSTTSTTSWVRLRPRTRELLEAIMLNKEGYVVECTADNIFLVKNGILKTPDPVHGALDGITRKTILELAQELNLPSETGLYTRFDLYTADECFLTGSGAEIVPVVAIDGRAIGEGEPGAMTQKLRGQFQDFVRHQV